MRKIILVSILCLTMISTGICFAETSVSLNDTIDDANLDYLQYYVKWDASREPDNSSFTYEEYLASLEKDKNNNGILDSLEDESDEVHAAAVQTGILGDLNGDELVDNKDVVLLYRHFAGWEQDINADILDLNGDGYTNSSDARHLLDYVSGWPDITLYKGKKYDIIYHLYTESMLSQQTEVLNTNQDYYYSSEGLTLKNITSDGYIFEGWYDGEGESATKIRKIEIGETGELELYARWTPRTYRIDFDSSLVEVAPKYYTIETGATLTNPSLANYIFVGWTEQESGRLVRGVPKGSFGNMTLVANWASRRNLAKPVPELGDPIIAEDGTNGKIIFIYELGIIENVPLFTLASFSTAEGITSSVTYTEQQSIHTSDARTIGQTIAKATTDSATWTLSEGWNSCTQVSQETLQQYGLTREEADIIAKSSANTYRMDTTQSESEVIVDSTQHAYKGSIGIGHSTEDTDTTESSIKYSVDKKNELEGSADATLDAAGVGSLKLGMKASKSINKGEETNDTFTDSDTTTDSWNIALERAGDRSKAITSSKNWNTSASYSNSNSISNTHSTSQQISELLSERYGYGSSYSENGEHSSGQAFTTQNSQQDCYSNTVTYDTSTLYTKEVQISHDGRIDGYYRQVLAGTMHVFGVVGYDVATRAYFAYSFSMLDDNTFEFLDYSKTTSNFNDNETGVIPFEIPSVVNDYVNSRIARTSGLQISMTGEVTAYSGDDALVIVPSYWDVDNGDGTFTSIKVTGISPDAFRNNTSIEGIMLPEYIRDIPDSAFEGCTSLCDVYMPGLTHIGNRAFYGCASLSTLTIPENVVSLGTNAFYNVNEVRISAGNSNVALAAVNSGAKSLVLNISSINEEIKDKVLEAPADMEVFEVQGGRKQFENLKVKSHAGKTRINGISFVDCTQVPLEMYSSSVDLNQTSVSGAGYCMILASNNCEVNLFGTNQMNSSTGNAIVCGNVTLTNSDSNVQAKLQVSGNVYVCGTITNQDSYLNVSNGEIIYISQEDYEKYINGVFQVMFDANGGIVQETERTAYSGTPIGALPNATRTGYTFAGWYTAVSGGTNVTASTSFVSSSTITVYAHWTANTYTVSFYENGGASASPTSKTVTYDSTYGTLATATWDCHTFEGWYTAASGGTKITSNTKVAITSSQTLYAHWTLNPEIGWVTEDQVPADAQITQTSWSYREYSESTSSTMEGWINNGEFWRAYASGSKDYASFPGGFDTSHSLYGQYEKSAPYESCNNGSTKRDVSTTLKGYIYWHWIYGVPYCKIVAHGGSDRTIASQRGSYSYLGGSGTLYFDRFFAFYSTTACPSLGVLSPKWVQPSSAEVFDCYDIIQSVATSAELNSDNGAVGTDRFFRINCYTCTYTDSRKIYKYYRDVSYSLTDPGNSSTIGNKVKYVKYRCK